MVLVVEVGENAEVFEVLDDVRVWLFVQDSFGFEKVSKSFKCIDGGDQRSSKEYQSSFETHFGTSLWTCEVEKKREAERNSSSTVFLGIVYFLILLSVQAPSHGSAI
ncbi:hypothetical protein K435DRAFT_806939 [Dendrothele bispora CBS 962.96]|uniref:Uncharacterized protein n=1 Tax=Dendrothele bispora (strain CBS 962.96) TaxID=1314807 RepID=A0A4S8L6A1_DENBC|nr:hypothetical protein K435DRAFT_806939 [Dendrothele bispora CBS 962.96]